MGNKNSGRRVMPLEKKFWRRVNKLPNGCWQWTGSTHGSGYGKIGHTINGQHKALSAHRVAYELLIGPIPDGLAVCHRCDNPFCVNPAHLFSGTIADNNQDMADKGRHWTQLHPDLLEKAVKKRSKLTDEDVHNIRVEYAKGGISQEQLANRYGIDQGYISQLVNHKRRR